LASVPIRFVIPARLRVLVLALLAWVHAVAAQTEPSVSSGLLLPGAACGLLAPCTRLGELGLHLSAVTSVRTDRDRSVFDAHGQLRGAVTFLDLAEVGGQLAGHLGRDPAGAVVVHSSPATVYARLRVFPLPFLRAHPESTLRVVFHAQHDLVTEQLGQHESPSLSRTTLLAIGGTSYGPIDLDGSLGVVFAHDAQRRPQQSAFTVGLASSVWFQRPVRSRPSAQLRLQVDALYQFAQDKRFSNQGTILAGLIGRTHKGVGGSVAAGPEFVGEHVGVRILAGFQVTWGPQVKNPWAERKAAEPHTTPAWIWTLLGALDPILREDGCVWTDPTPHQASYNWFCIGKPDPTQPGQILLPNGQRLPVGTHLWEWGTTLHADDGTKVADIPWNARFRKAVLDHVGALLEHISEPDPALCDGRIDPIPRGLDAGWASVVANDDMGGRAAVVGMQIYRELTCHPEAQSSIEILGLLGKVGGKGPLRAKPTLGDDRYSPAPGKSRSSGGTGEGAEHTTPARSPLGKRRFSIRENEARGGHVLSRHVGKSEEQLKQRLQDIPQLRIASSFHDEATAQQAISAALEKNEAVIAQWLKQPDKPFSLVYEAASDVGIVVERSASSVRPSNVARIVLRPNPDGGFYVLTAYLE
jgi:hypothetical protein